MDGDSDEKVQADILIERIQDAFKDVALEDGITIHEADLEGVYRDDSVRVAARAKDPETSWQEVPDSKIYYHTSLNFFDIKGWRFYLPAYMIWSLKNWRTTDSLSSDSTIWALKDRGFGSKSERFSALNEEQSKVVLAFLQHHERYSGEPDARESIDSYWYKFEK